MIVGVGGEVLENKQGVQGAQGAHLSEVTALGGFAQKPIAFDEDKGLTATIWVTNKDLRQILGVFVQSP